MVVGEAGETVSGIRGIRRLRPELTLVEFSSEVVDGPLICNMVKMKGLATKVVLIAEDIRGENVYKAVVAGSDNVLPLHAAPDNLLKSIRAVLKGEMMLTHTVQTELQNYLEKRESGTQIIADRVSSRPLLSDTELQVLQMLAKGMSIHATGQALHLSPSTVKNHRQSIFAKLGVKNAPAAVYFAVQKDILHC